MTVCPPCSRRTALRAIGGAAVGLTAGCLGELGRSASDVRHRSVAESNPDHTPESFRTYVDRMHGRYGEHGVWGIKREGKTLPFVGAWTGSWALRKPKTPSKNGRQLRIPVDYAFVLYRLRGGPEHAHRLWMWTAATPEQSDVGYGGTALVELSVGIALDGSGRLGPYAPKTDIGPDDSPVYVGLSGPPSARRPIPAGRLQPASDRTRVGPSGAFALDWAGAYGRTVSVAGVCELKRDTDSGYQFTLRSGTSGTQGTR